MRFVRCISFAAVLTLLALSGCGTSVFQEPQVDLEGVQLGGIGLRGGTLLVNLRIVNPNGFALSANQLTYDLAVADPDVPGDTAWVEFASGTYDQAFSVGARDTSRVQIPIEFSYSGLGGAASSLLSAGTFDYRASGSVNVGTPLGSYDVPFRKRGIVTLMGVS
ncbi:MAG TPA: LEA type 2 family protein [Longimicrobiaceae bacterium]|nr:LEA type 2 family protein [Longimicrobiaceae bacterium]